MMNTVILRRQELKYYVSNTDINIIQRLICNLMKLDHYADPVSKEYTVTSLYFDTPTSSNLDEKLDGILDREKHRIRIYNSDYSTLKLETKEKSGTVIFKKSSPTSIQVATKLINGDLDLCDEDDKFLVRFKTKLKSSGSRPKVIVEYDREAYYLPYGNIRITIDKNLRTYNSHTKLFEIDSVPKSPVFLNNHQILEVKFDIELPTPIKEVLKLVPAVRASVSKFVLCQRYIDQSLGRDHLISPF